jgi:hypothetical protein
MTWLGPRRLNRIDTSLLIEPKVDDGTVYRLTALGSPR